MNCSPQNQAVGGRGPLRDPDNANQAINNVKQNNGLSQYADHLVKAQLPNQQRTTVRIPAGTTIREALTKALKLRKLEPEMCTVFRVDPDRRIRQRIDWDVDVSMLKGDDIVVETKDKVPMHTQLSHNFAKFYLTLSRCHFCQGNLWKGIKCLTCGIEFHAHSDCSKMVPRLCEPSIEHNSYYYKHLLARPNGFSPPCVLSTSESPTNTLPIKPRERARSADENSKQKSKPNNNDAQTANSNHTNNHERSQQNQIGRSYCHINKSGLPSSNSDYHTNELSGSSTPTTTAINFPNHIRSRNFPQMLGEKWEIDPKEITYGPRIGQGSFATVYEGTLHGPVAVKELNVRNPTQAQLQDFINEVAVLKKLRHPNILLFRAYALRPKLIIVTQLCPGRSLYKHLHIEESRTFTKCEVYDIAYGVAQGMEYLHAKHIIHRDLKSNNIFIHDEKNLTVKIGDFGLATFKTRYEGAEQIYHPTGSILWMAPEVIRTKPGVNPFTFKSDVYSYGIVIYELLTRKLPYFDFKYKDALLFLIGLGDPELSPKLNMDVILPNMPEGLKTLMQYCVDRDVEQRPQFAKIIGDLKGIRLSRIPKSTSEPLRLNNLDFSTNHYHGLI